jgi:carbamoyltransferase
LGHRSILADPRNGQVCAILNEGLKRHPAMPFAPAIIDACFEEILEAPKAPAAMLAARFMTITVNVRPEWREKIPAVVHVDGKARPQVLTAEDNPFFYEVVSHFRRLTGVGCVLNTSCNRHHEPIVNTPAQALSLLEKGPLNFLVLGSYWVTAPCPGTLQEVSVPSSGIRSAPEGLGSAA